MWRKVRYFCLILLWLPGSFPLAAQLQVQWERSDAGEGWPVRMPDAPVTDSLSALLLAGEVIRDLWDESHLLASLDAWEIQDSVFRAVIYVGPTFSWSELRNGNVPDPIWQKARINNRDYAIGKEVRYASARLLQEKLLRQFEEGGYPFARVAFDSIQLSESVFSAVVNVEPGPRIVFGELEVEGDAGIRPSYLESYLGIQPGTDYKYSRILDLRDRIRELPFLREIQRPQVIFRGSEAVVQLALERKRASRFDFLIGLQPSGQPGQDRNFLITGKLESEFWNQFGRGERLYAKFERLRPGTQSLDIGFSYPYLLDLPFGVDLAFRQYRRDSTFNDVAGDVGLRYLFAGENYLEAFWNFTGSNLLTVNEEVVRATRQLPENLDYRTTLFGLEGQLEGLDYRFNPRQGFRFRGRSGVGNKSIIRNSLITSLSDPEDPAFSYGTLYDSVQEQSLQLRTEWQVDYFVPLFTASALKFGVKGGWLWSDAPIYRNEQFRIGGIKVLRGFDEESLWATFYSVFSVEYRLLSGQNSNFFVFADYGYTEDVRVGVRAFDRPYGFGGGLTFETAAGLFSLSLAVGGREGVSPDFRNPKVHLGYLSIF